MQLKELISLPIYANAKVIAGRAGLSNIVQTLTIMDAPDIIHFLKPQELLLTTGYAMKDHPEALLGLVTNMAEVGCAGLAVKTRRFIDELPDNVIKRADELHFPIIELSLEYSLGDISNQSLSCILEKRTDELHYALTTHKQFSQMIMQGKSTADIIEALASLTASPVLLLSTDFAQLYASTPFPREKAADWIALIRSKAEEEAISSALELLAPSLAASDEAEQSTLEILPIFTFQLEGYLIAATKESSNHLRSLTKHAMEQAANVIGLELVKKQAVKERSRRYKNEFFSNCVDGLIASEQELHQRGKYYHLLGHSHYVCGVAKSDTLFEITRPEAELYEAGRSISERDRQYFALKSELAKLEHHFVLFTKNDYFCLILAPYSQSDAAEGKENKLLEQLQHVVCNMTELHGIPISIGIGDPVSKLTDVPLSYQEAIEALQMGYAEHKTQFAQPYRAKNFSYLLRMLPKEEIAEYYEETFRGLLNVEEREKAELLKTLRIFYDSHCGLAETAKQLFVHRNTVTYRLEKCERLTGRLLRDPVESFRFRVAFAMEPLLGD